MGNLIDALLHALAEMFSSFASAHGMPPPDVDDSHTEPHIAREPMPKPNEPTGPIRVDAAAGEKLRRCLFLSESAQEQHDTAQASLRRHAKLAAAAESLRLELLTTIDVAGTVIVQHAGELYRITQHTVERLPLRYIDDRQHDKPHDEPHE